MPLEMELTAILCSLILQGQTEIRHHYVAAGEDRFIRVDCETDSHVIEVGLDGKRSSFDSLHQTLFAAELTGKLPMVVIIDRDGVSEAAQHQAHVVARRVGVSYLTVSEDFLVRWQMTQAFRAGRPVPLFGIDRVEVEHVRNVR